MLRFLDHFQINWKSGNLFNDKDTIVKNDSQNNNVQHKKTNVHFTHIDVNLSLLRHQLNCCFNYEDGSIICLEIHFIVHGTY